MFDFRYWILRFLHHYWKRRFFPSIIKCRTCGHYVQRNHLEKQPRHRVAFYGLHITKPKPEQFKFRTYFPKIRKLPSKVDLRPALINGGFKVFNQGNQGSCTANCGCADKAYHEIVQGDYPGVFSRAFDYYEMRKLHDWQNQDSGANMEDIGTVHGQEGVCLDKTMPYSQLDYTTKPSSAAYSEALNWKDAPNQTRLNITEIKAALATSGPVRFGISIVESFETTTTNGFIPEPGDNEQILGGHAVLCLGYDDTLTHNGVTGYFILVNSWGTSWGDKGYFYLSYANLQKLDSDYGGTDNWQQLDLDAPPNPHVCPAGQHWDDAQGKCVPDTPTPTPWDDFVKFIVWLFQQLFPSAKYTIKDSSVTFNKP